MKIGIDIKDCSECPHFDSERIYTADSFEMAFDWFCLESGERKKISGYVETFDKTPIPEWCPCKIEE